MILVNLTINSDFDDAQSWRIAIEASTLFAEDYVLFLDLGCICSTRRFVDYPQEEEPRDSFNFTDIKYNDLPTHICMNTRL